MQRRTKPFTIPTLLSLVVLIVLASGWSWRGTLGLQRVDAAPRPVQPIMSEQARALALNSLAHVAGGYELTNPGHTATFTRAGLRFNGRNGGPEWRWRLTSIEAAGGAPLDAVEQGAVVPLRLAPGLVAFPRGGLVEQYVARPSSIEQQFIIAQPLDLGGANLVIAGAVQSAGSFETRPNGWLWRNADPARGGRGVVSLGDVRVFDADGRALPARMDVTAQTTHLTVDGAALAAARYPVTIDPEVGTNDFRISDMGPNTTAGYEALQSKVAYNSTTKQFLVVWRGDEQADLQAEIHGQLIDAATGAEVGTNDFLIARIGTAGDPATDAIEPAVAYNSVRNEFLVVFAGDNAPDPAGPPPLIIDTFEIYGQRVAANGSLTGGQLRLSDMGIDDTNGSYDANDPAVAYNAGSDQYLVVWSGDDNTAPLINNELEIWGQVVGYSAGNLVEVGTNDFQISTMGTDGVGTFDAREPSVAYNSAASEYLVVWSGNDAVAQPTGAFEIFGQRLTAAGAPVGTDDFLLGDSGDEAYTPDVAYNSTDNQYLVVWEGDNGAGNDFEIYGQLLNGTGGESGADFQISDAGSTSAFLAQTPAVAYNSAVNEYLVVWKGEDDFGGLIDGEFEAFGKRLNAAGATIEGTLRLSNMGPNGAANSSVQTPDVAYSDFSLNDYLTVWAAESQPTTAAGEAEIWGQLVALQADLRITKTLSSPAGPAPGEAVQYTVTYSNLGPDPVFNIVITDLVPAGVTSPSFSTSGVTGSAPVLRGGTTYIWDVARLNSGQGGTITINGTVGALANGTVVGNTASIATTSVIVDTNAGNGSQTANFTVNTPPTVAMSSAAPNPTNTSPIPVTVTFNESVTGFAAGDITTSNGTVNNFSGSGANYTFNLVPSGQGLVTADIAAGVALDSGSKGNLAATQFSRTYDSVAPTVTINQAAGQADPTTNSPINFTVVFNEVVSGFSSADVSLSGTAGATTAVVSGSGPTYNVAVSGMTTGGPVIATIGAGVATDAAGNGNSASTSTDNTVTFVVDSTPPTVAMSSAAPNPTNSSPIAVTAQFSENVTGFIATDIVAGNATVNNFIAVDGDTYTFNLVPSGQGLVTADIGAGVATDAGGNPNTAATQFSRTYDSVAPAVTINQAAGQADPTLNSPINFTVVFNEVVSGFSSADVTLSGTAGATTVVVSGSGPTYNVAVSGMTTNGTVIATIGAGVATDAAGNGNSASTSTDNTVTFIIDSTQPSVAMSSLALNPTNTSPIAVTAQFSENVTGFIATDIVAGNATVNNFIAVDGDTYTFNLVPSGQGLVTADIGAGVATDVGGNPNNAATQFSRTYDSVAPTVTINQAAGQADPTLNSPINFTVVFNEVVSGFSSADVSLSGTAGATTAVVSGSGPTYNVAVSGMSTNGTVIATIGAGVVSDAAGNGNSVSTSTDNTVTFIFDNTQPSVAMSSLAPNPTNSSPIAVMAQFSENVTGFTAGDITTSNGTISNFVAVDGDTYTFDLVPTGQGLVTADIAAGVAVDGVGNLNDAATQFSRTYDSIGPTVAVDQAAGQADPTAASPVNFTVVFGEPVSGFDSADVTLSGTAGATTAVVSGSSPTYNVAVTGMTVNGTVIVTIGAGVATDATGNSNSASTSADNTVTFVADNTQPSVAMNSAVPNPTNSSPIAVTAQFSKNVIGFIATDIVVSNATVSNFVAVDGDTYTFDLVPSGQGLVTADIAAGVATDVVSNPNLAAAQFSRTYDSVVPTVTINQAAGQADPTTNSPINFTVVFNEPVSGFASADVSLVSTAGAVAAVVSGSGTTYNVAVSGMTTNGTVTASILAKAATDAAGNSSTVSTSTDNTVAFILNRQPVAANDSVTTTEDTAIIIDPFTNDNDVDGDALTVSGMTLPANGSVVDNGDGTVTYTPAPNFNGTDSFTYRASDGNAVSNTAIVTVTVQPVNDAPSFTPGPNLAVEKNSGPYSAVWATASSAGPANESGQTRTFLVTSNSNPGLFSAAPSIAPNGTLTFTPAPGATGQTTIAVVLKDNGGTANGGIDTSVTRYFTISIGAARFNYFIYVVLSQGQ